MKIMPNKNNTDTKNNLFNFLILWLIVPILLTVACESPSLKANRTPLPTPENTQTELERDLQTMKTANFEYSFVFRRKDGGALDGEDKAFMKANLPPNTNRVLTTDSGKAVIAGSHFKFTPESLENLRKRFNVEDFSQPAENKPEEKTNTNN